MATASTGAIDRLRRAERARRARTQELARELERRRERAPDLAAALDDPFDDDLLRLVFTACHPVLSTDARVALTLRLLGGLTTDRDRARVPRPRGDGRAAHRARQADAVRGAASRSRCPTPRELAERLASVLEVDLPRLQRGLRGHRRRATGCGRSCSRRRCASARILAELLPDEAEVHGLVALMELQASRARRAHRTPTARRAAARPGPLALGLAADRRGLARARARVRDRRPARALHAAGRDRRLPRPRARAPRTPTGSASSRSTTRSPQLTPSPVVELNRAVAVGMASGPAAALELVDALAQRAGAARLPPAARRARRPAREARPQRRGAAASSQRAAALTGNERERAVLLQKMAACGQREA